MDEPVRESVSRLRAHRDRHYETGKALFGPSPGDIYELDFFFTGALKRSYCLLRGFCDLIESQNFVAAAPLIRLQLDNCFRTAAAGWAENPHLFASEVLGGTPIRNLKDNESKKMTDRHLIDRLAREWPWVKDIYSETSGFIHLSEKHIFNALTITSEERREAQITISDYDEFIPSNAYLVAVDAFARITDLFLGFVNAYADVRRQ